MGFTEDLDFSPKSFLLKQSGFHLIDTTLPAYF